MCEAKRLGLYSLPTFWVDLMKPSPVRANFSRPVPSAGSVVGSHVDEAKRRSLDAGGHQNQMVSDVREAFGFMPMQLQGKVLIRWRNL